MKKVLLAITVLAAISLQSCEKWFDVTSNTEIKAEDQFSSPDGFRDALMGVYLKMSTPSMYGRDMTYAAVDVLSQQYGTFSQFGVYYGLQRFAYSEQRPQSQIESIWNSTYNAIININTALEYVEIADFAWNQIDKDLIKGELLGLRTFLHFDLMRLFGHSEYRNRPELASRMAIPYVRGSDPSITSQRSYTETFALMMEDIDGALALLDEDPIYPAPNRADDYFSEINRNGFYNNRQNRFNYFAALALKARVLAWQGGAKLAEAATIAEEVIEQGPQVLLRPGTDVFANRTMPEEHIFTLRNERLYITAEPLFRATATVDYQALYIPNARAEALYEVSVPGIGAVDVRYTTLLEPQQLGRVPVKLIGPTSGPSGNKFIPLMKLPEMYYIAAEHYANTDLPKAIGLLNTVRESRRITTLLSTAMNKEQFLTELSKEYQKEYVSEGQLFYFYKRLGLDYIPNYSNTIVADDDIYMLPFPADEFEFGNRVQ